MTANVSSPANRSGELDGIRGLAVGAVLIHHLENLSGNPLLLGSPGGMLSEVSALARGGGLGIDMFFVLSAYLLGRPWVDPTRRPAAADYFWRRARRLLPAYYVVLLLPLLFMTGKVIPYELVASRTGVESIGAHLLLVQFVFPVSSGGFIVHGGLWTLTIELLLYISIPVMAKAFVGRRWMWALPSAVALALTWRCAVRNSLGWLVDFYGWTVDWSGSDQPLRATFLANQFPSFLGDFAIGLTIASLVASRRLGPLSSRRTVAVSAAGLAGVLIGFRLDGTPDPERLSYYAKHLTTSLGTGLLIAAAVAGNARELAPMRLRPLVWLGERGYGVFLWHLPVIWVLLDFPMIHVDGSRRAMFELAAWTIPITCALAEVTYQLIEQPAMVLPRPSLHDLLRRPPWFLVPAGAGMLIAVWWLATVAVR
jgi:peptidoglycan/LPS O-acetylase OafA/YrhL